MKTILFIIVLFCISVKAETADTLKLSNGYVVLLNDANAVLLAGGGEPPPPPIQGGWIHQSNGRKLFFNNGKAIITQ